MWRRMPDLLRQAFRVATSGAPGPVHLRVQSHLGQITEEEAELDPLVEARLPARTGVSSRAADGARAEARSRRSPRRSGR